MVCMTAYDDDDDLIPKATMAASAECCCKGLQPQGGGSIQFTLRGWRDLVRTENKS